MGNFKKPGFLWTVIIIALIALLGVGCLSSSVGSKGSSSFEFKNINSLMGKDKEEVFKTLKTDPEKDVTVDNLDAEERFKINESMKINGEDCEVFINFYNGILIAVDYIFDSGEAGYNYAKVIRGQAEEIYGEPITYPESDNRLDNLKEFKEGEIEDSMGRAPYHESWATEDDEEVLKILAGDREIKDIENLYGTDIVLNLAFSEDGRSWVNVRYSAARNPRGEWRIAP